jgi:hypothetical protein
MIPYMDRNGRDIFQSNVGFTGQQAPQWRVENTGQKSKPGLMAVTTNLPVETRRCIFQLCSFLANDVVLAVLGGTAESNLFVPNESRRKDYTNYLAKTLNGSVPCDLRGLFDAFALNLNPPGVSSLSIHYDPCDDTRRGMDAHVVASECLDFSGTTAEDKNS